jgi:hypothetical protein
VGYDGDPNYFKSWLSEGIDLKVLKALDKVWTYSRQYEEGGITPRDFEGLVGEYSIIKETAKQIKDRMNPNRDNYKKLAERHIWVGSFIISIESSRPNLFSPVYSNVLDREKYITRRINGKILKVGDYSKNTNLILEAIVDEIFNQNGFIIEAMFDLPYNYFEHYSAMSSKADEGIEHNHIKRAGSESMKIGPGKKSDVIREIEKMKEFYRNPKNNQYKKRFSCTKGKFSYVFGVSPTATFSATNRRPESKKYYDESRGLEVTICSKDEAYIDRVFDRIKEISHSK